MLGELYKGVPHGLCKVRTKKGEKKKFEGFGVMTHGKLDKGPFLLKNKDEYIYSYSMMVNGHGYCVGK